MGMSRTRSDLIVPIRDRRQSRRIITTKNLSITLLVLVLLFAGVSLWSEYGRKGGSDDYGRLFGTQVKATIPARVHVQEVIHEAAVPDVTSADPTLVAPAARAQAYGVGVAPTPSTMITASGTITPVQPVVAGTGAAAIVGGADGVTLTRRPGEGRLLKGGIFRNPAAPEH
jgi:hypothetical protein